MQQDDLDKKATGVFAGKVVRKDLLHQIKGGENVPSYVLEYLLGKYCASDNDEEIRIGVDAVKETLTTNYFRHDEANKAQSMVEQKGRHRFIDRVEVRFLPSENKYWASMDHFGYAKIHIAEEFYRRYERLLRQEKQRQALALRHHPRRRNGCGSGQRRQLRLHISGQRGEYPCRDIRERYPPDHGEEGTPHGFGRAGQSPGEHEQSEGCRRQCGVQAEGNRDERKAAGGLLSPPCLSRLDDGHGVDQRQERIKPNRNG